MNKQNARCSHSVVMHLWFLSNVHNSKFYDDDDDDNDDISFIFRYKKRSTTTQLVLLWFSKSGKRTVSDGFVKKSADSVSDSRRRHYKLTYTGRRAQCLSTGGQHTPHACGRPLLRSDAACVVFRLNLRRSSPGLPHPPPPAYRT